MANHHPQWRTRWFTDDDADLFIWVDDEQQIMAFQLTARLPGHYYESIVEWRHNEGLRTGVVDPGDNQAMGKMSPVVRYTNVVDFETLHAIRNEFRLRSIELEVDLRKFIQQKLTS